MLMKKGIDIFDLTAVACHFHASFAWSVAVKPPPFENDRASYVYRNNCPDVVIFCLYFY